jgi:hypothetical protein
MNLYYKRAVLTIAVDSAKGDWEGFIHLNRKSDPPLAIFPDTGFTNYRNMDSATAVVKNAAGTTLDSILLRRPRKRLSEPLSERGWTLQETILSPRTVHYSAAELKWECRKKIGAETMLACDDANAFRHRKRVLGLSNRLVPDEMSDLDESPSPFLQ